jgi:hypothetical protein
MTEIYGASLNDVPDLKHMPLTFNEVQMHKTGTDGKRNSERFVSVHHRCSM